MKIAITSQEDKLDSKMDSRFGRCSFFAIFDTETKKTEFVTNPNKESDGGAGPASAQFVIAEGVKKVISGDFGGKVKDLFLQLHVEMQVMEDKDKSIAQIINSIS